MSEVTPTPNATPKSKFTAAELQAALLAAAQLAAAFDPKDAAIISGLMEAGTKIVGMIREIASQTKETEAAVWANVTQNYSASLSAFEAAARTPMPHT